MTNPFIYINQDGIIFRESLNEREAHAEVAKCYQLDAEQKLRLLLALTGKEKGDGRTKIVYNDGTVRVYNNKDGEHCW